MASHVHTTTTSASRRNLSALLAGTMLAAAAPAPARATPDAELIRLGAQVDAAFVAECAAWQLADLEEGDGPATHEANRLADVTMGLTNRILALPATTDAGITAKVRAYAACMGRVSQNERRAHTTDEKLLISIRDDLAAMDGFATGAELRA